ncbi:hypothetical protein EB796_024330 [Bugula neritina]|uniref:Uncharacterized protein n=1 Tax=Bugula neritina TaxID=10212 RepID=A0A7J7IVV7_BUGNE|nr:hypothetical protein EB796_024330 [Bugula neritina]
MDLEKPEGSGVSGCWVNIAGSPKKVETAKSYICNLCDPPDTGTTAYPGDLHGYLSDKSVVFDLENKYSVIVEFIDADEVDQPGKATVKGNELNVALALSAIEDMIAQYIEKNQITLQESSSCSHLSTQHSYSDQTSSKLNESLMGVSNQIQLDKKAAASYPDVMKKLMLSWVAASADGNEETVDVDIADDTMAGSDGDADKTVVHSAPKSPITSTPIVPPNTSRVKVERLSYVPIPRDVKSLEDSPGLRLSNRQAAAGRPAVDATDSPSYLASRPGPSGIQRQTKGSPPLVDLCETEHFSSDDETTIMVIPPKKMAASTNHAAASRTKPAHNPAARESRCEGSPTTQTERDISTISLDDDVSAASEYQVIDETGYDSDMIRLAEIGATRGYTQVEIAQALSLCESEDLSEQKFFSHLTQVRRESQTPPSPRTPQGQRPKKGRNAALESINKRQQSMSPGVREVMPIEKRVRTAAPPPSARMPG